MYANAYVDKLFFNILVFNYNNNALLAANQNFMYYYSEINYGSSGGS